MTMNKTWLAAIAIAVASATQVQAQTVLPHTNTCVSFSAWEPPLEDRWPRAIEFDEDGWALQYTYRTTRVTNSCRENVYVIYLASNLGPKGEDSACGYMFMFPGETEMIELKMRSNLRPRLNWCSEYFSSEDQELAGYKGCRESNMMPSGC